MDPWYAAGQVVEQLLEEHTKAAQEYIDAVERVIRDAGLATERAVLVDNPKSAILDEAKEWEADLIVVGSHGRRGLDRLLLGSVSEAVAMHAHCSVDVIRQPAGLG
jgi:nucleotide-binding universal stress UspA family protein